MIAPAAPATPTPAAAPAPDLNLDACAALRADVATQDAAPSADAPPGAPGTWLVLVTSLERAAQLAPRARPAHFRRARVVWDAAADTLGEPQYAAAGARLARWRATDPTLPLVKRVLWALEQPEAAGYTQLALAGYSALGRLLPPDDVRRGYVLAQSARAVRTLGDLDAARERYELAEYMGQQAGDSWLRVRSAIGLGAAYQQAGNQPRARAVFRNVIDQGSPDARFTAAAHHGLVLAAIAAQDWDEALSHGWELLHAGRRGAAPRCDVLLLMAAVCRRTGRPRAAAAAATAALSHTQLPEDPVVARRILIEVALDTAARTQAFESATALREHLHSGVGPFERARALLTLGLVDERWGARRRALAAVGEALALARAHGFHELAYHMETVHDRLATAANNGRMATPDRQIASGGVSEVALTPTSQRIVAQLQELEISQGVLAGAG